MAQVAKKYAKALYDVALDKDMLEAIYEEFATIDQAVES